MSRWDEVDDALSQRRGGGGGNWKRANCPFCPEAAGVVDHRASLSVNPEIGVAKCFRCQTKAFAPWFETDSQAMPHEPSRVHVTMPDGCEPVATGPAWAREYLAERNIPVLVAADACVFAATFFGRRVIIPAHNGAGELVGWVARSVDGAEPKYRAAKGPWASVSVWNEPAVFADTEKPLFIVEGVFDALALWPDAVALYGKVISPAQLRLLAASPRRLVVVMDGDARMSSWAIQIQLATSGKLNTTTVMLPAKRDPADMPRAWIEDRANI